MTFDLAVLAGYARIKRGTKHLRCIGRLLAQTATIQSGAYAEALLREFDEALAEVQAVVEAEKGKTDRRTFFEAMKVKRELLEAKAKALGLGATPGRPQKGKDLPLPGAVQSDDVAKMVENFLRTRGAEAPPNGSMLGSGDEVAGMDEQIEPGESS